MRTANDGFFNLPNGWGHTSVSALRVVDLETIRLFDGYLCGQTWVHSSHLIPFKNLGICFTICYSPENKRKKRGKTEGGEGVN